MTDNNNNPSEDLGYGKIFGVLLRRSFWLLGVFLLVFSFMAFKAIKKGSTYESKMSLLVESNYQEKKESSQDNFLPQSNLELDYTTQLVLMTSTSLLEKAVNRLKSDYPDLTVEELKENLTVSQLENDKTKTKIYEVVYKSKSATKSQKVLEAIQKVYQEYNINQQQIRLINGLSFIDKQLPASRKSLTTAQYELDNFRKTNDLIDPQQKFNQISELLSTVIKEKQLTQVNLQEAQSRYQSLTNILGMTPEEGLIFSRFSQSDNFKNIWLQLQQIDLTLKQNQEVFTDNDPRIPTLKERHQELEQKLEQEILENLGIQVNTQQLLQKGPLGGTELNLIAQLLETQTNLENLKERERQLTLTEKELENKLKQFPDLIAEYNRKQPELEILQKTVEQLLEAKQKLGIEIARGGFNWEVVEPPKPGVKKNQIKKDLILGVIVSLFLGGAAAFLVETLDNKLYTEDEIKRQIKLPLLGVVPHWEEAKGFRLKAAQNQSSKPFILLAAEQPWFRAKLDLNYKRLQLIKPSAKTIVITSALELEGKSTVAITLALSASRLNKKVLIIDVNLRYPTLHSWFSVGNEEGLANFLSGDIISPNISKIYLGGTEFDFLNAGKPVLDPLPLLSSSKLKKILKEFEENYDLILLDTTSILDQIDALEIASLSDSIIFVVNIKKINKAQLQQSSLLLNQLKPVGLIINQIKQKGNKG